MIEYTSEKQLKIEGFDTTFEKSLSSDNRWVQLSKIVPWDKFASIYMSKMHQSHGRPGIAPRRVLGALIIKHIMNLDDVGVIEIIQENIYMQYFVGLTSFSTEPVFSPTLFVDIRKRFGAEDFDKLNVHLLEFISKPSDDKHKERFDSEQGKDISNDDEKSKTIEKENAPEPKIPNKGKLQMDATVADQYITYPTDTTLLREATKQCEKIIDLLYDMQGKKGVKPRTYRRVLSKVYLGFQKKRRKSNKEIRKTNRLFIEALNRDISHINKMLDTFDIFPLPHKEQRMLWIVSLLLEQQQQMFTTKTHSCKNRIVSIFQPHVRPIVRGKQKSKVEFGSKLGVSLDQGIARVNNLSWEAYNEGEDLTMQVEAYKQVHGYFPELVQVDKIYATRKNRKYLSDRNIRITAPPLGRPVKREAESSCQRQKRKKEAGERNQIEGKFGQGKNGYNLNKIRARLQATSESWIGAIFFIMNLIHLKNIGVFLSSFLFILEFIHDISLKILNSKGILQKTQFITKKSISDAQFCKIPTV